MMESILQKQNKLDLLFRENKGEILSVFFTAGYPKIEDTGRLLLALQNSGADLVEIGIPFSDPIADGETIQLSSQKAIENGITLDKIFDQIEEISSKVNIPIILMGYLNPVFKYGWTNFCKRCAETGVDGLILPDLPMAEFEEIYSKDLEEYNLRFNFLITPQTSEERIRKIDELASGFIYVVSSASITGSNLDMNAQRAAYFKRIKELRLNSNRLIGFGIHDHETFQNACKYADGAIIGSAFIKHIKDGFTEESIKKFVTEIKDGNSGK